MSRSRISIFTLLCIAAILVAAYFATRSTPANNSLSAEETHRKMLQARTGSTSEKHSSPVRRVPGKKVSVARRDIIPQEEVFGAAAGDIIPEDVSAKLGMTDEQKQLWASAMSTLRQQMTLEASKHIQKDEAASSDECDVYQIESFASEALILKNAFIQSLREKLPSDMLDKLVERYNWVSYFGNFGTNNSVIEFFETEVNGKSYLQFKASYYNPVTGRFAGGGTADYSDLHIHWGNLFTAGAGDSVLGVIQQ